tara:strand:+ start:743 stop:1054 length:312 start_codon:yes stop_codon:yes gene_type:complete
MAIIITKMVEAGDSEGNTVYLYPEWCIIKSQFFRDPDDETFVTIGLGGGTEITKAELKTRALDIHTRHPFLNTTDTPPVVITNKTTAEVEALVDDWCTERNAS